MKCKYIFTNKRRRTRSNTTGLFRHYIDYNISSNNLSTIYNISSRSVRRHLDKVKIIPYFNRLIYDSIVIMDTTYFNRNFGVMVFRDHYTKKNIYWKYVKYETLKDYISGIELIMERGINVQGIVCDGKRGILNAFDNIPVQLCQFHQIAIIRRYITRNPRLEAGKELKKRILNNF